MRQYTKTPPITVLNAFEHTVRRQQISRPRLVHTLRKQSSGGVESITAGTGGEHQLQCHKEMMAARWVKQKSSYV